MIRRNVLPLGLLIAVLACGDDSASGGAGAAGGGGAGGAPAVCTVDLEALPEDTAPAPPIYTPRWAFHPWISKDISTGEDSRTFIQGFLDRDIPVGVLVLDSPWETHYNTYEPNPVRYPEFGQMVADFRALGVRTVVWTTQMINTSGFDLEPGGDGYEGPSPDFEPASQCGYFVNEDRVSPWWKGQGQGIDFFNPDATVFWHRMLDRVIDLGVSGFKLDFGENYIDKVPMTTADGEKSLQEYSEAYYEDFFAYGAAKLGSEEFVTMVRPYDESYQFEGRFFARPEHAPVAWVGDNRRDYIGMQDALDHMFRSADAGYVVIGSDIGGYLDRNDLDLTESIPLDPDVFMRWTALGAMNPFMQLHGRANLEPWTFPEKAEDVTSTYRFWANLHEQMVPFFDSVATQAYQGSAVRMMAPLTAEAAWPNDYRFMLGGALLVVPVVDGSGARDIEFPEDARYFDLFDPAGLAIEPGTTLTAVDVSDPTRIPVYLREGAIIPMEVAGDVTPFGTAASAGALTVLIAPSEGGSSFEVVAEDESIEATVSAQRDASSATVDLGAHARRLILRVRVDQAPMGVDVDGTLLEQALDQAAFDAAAESYRVDGGYVWIKLPAGSGETVLIQ